MAAPLAPRRSFLAPPLAAGAPTKRLGSVYGALATLAVAGLGPAQAQDAWLRGDWCAENGERMVVERSGPGFNEHTVCTWLSKPPSGTTVNTRIACANIYGDGARMDEQTLRFRAVKTGPRSVSVRIGSGAAMAYAKC